MKLNKETAHLVAIKLEMELLAKEGTEEPQIDQDFLSTLYAHKETRIEVP